MFANDRIYRDAAAVVLHDTNEQRFMGLYIGGAGNLKVTTAAGTDLTFSGLTAGSILPIEVRVVWATGSTATLVVGFKP